MPILWKSSVVSFSDIPLEQNPSGIRETAFGGLMLGPHSLGPSFGMGHIVGMVAIKDQGDAN